MRFVEAQLAPHQRAVVGGEGGLIFIKHFAGLRAREQTCEGFGQTTEIPERDRGLLIVGVAPGVVRVVRDETETKFVHEAERAVVERKTQHRHIVRVHHAVREADGLPLRDKLRGARHYRGEEFLILVGRVAQFREVLRDDVIGERADVLKLTAIVEDLERAEAHVTRREAQQSCRGLCRLALHRLVTADDAQRPRRRDAERVHRFAAQILAYRRAQDRAPVEAARVRRRACALQMQIPLRAFESAHLAQQQRAPVAQLRHIDAELMARIQHRQRLCAGEILLPTEVCDELRTVCFGRIEIE